MGNSKDNEICDNHIEQDKDTDMCIEKVSSSEACSECVDKINSSKACSECVDKINSSKACGECIDKINSSKCIMDKINSGNTYSRCKESTSMDETCIDAIDKNNSINIVDYLSNNFNLPSMDIRTVSPLTLAYIGDGIYDLIVRTIIVKQGNAPVNKLHRKVSELVKAQTQMKMITAIEGMLSENEVSVYKRGRNAKSYTSAKNASKSDYREATGFEALIGYLYLEGNMNRVIELIKEGFESIKD